MKQFICELCGSDDIIKQDGMYLCRGCGTKYSLEEAKKLLVEVGQKACGEISTVDTAQIEKYLELSENAANGGNGQSAFDYANKALELDPHNYMAWVHKMKAMEYLATFGNLRLPEVVEAGFNAINYAPEESKDDVERMVYLYQLQRALDLMKISMNKLADTADIKNTFRSFLLISMLSATKNTMDVDRTTVELYDKVSYEAVELALSVPDEALEKYSELPKALLECAKQYQYVTDTLNERFKVYGASLTKEAVSFRDERKKSMENKASKVIKVVREKELAQKKAEADKRFKEYWESHQEEKERLESEKKELLENIKALELKLKDIPQLAEQSSLQKEINDLAAKKKALGLFKGKEKKEIQANIDTLGGKLKQVAEAVNSQTTAIKKEINPLKSRINAIDEELTKER